MINVDILHIEKLARLSLTESERIEMRADLEKILTMVAKLSDIDTSDTAPLVYLSENAAPLRPDTVALHLDRARVLQNAPLADGVYFKVPKVIG